MTRVVWIWFSSAELCVLGFAFRAEIMLSIREHNLTHADVQLELGLGELRKVKALRLHPGCQTPFFCFDKGISLIQLSILCPIPWKEGDKDQTAVSFCSFQATFLAIWGQLLFLQRGSHTKTSPLLRASSKCFLNSCSFGAYNKQVACWIDEGKLWVYSTWTSVRLLYSLPQHSPIEADSQ